MIFTETSKLAACAVVLALAAGCTSTSSKNKGEDGDETGTGKSSLVLLSDDELYTGIPSDQLAIKDEDVKFPPDKDADPELIARWVTERRNLISWCLSREQTLPHVNEFGVETIRYKRVFQSDKRRSETRLDQAISIAKKVVEKVPDATRERYRFAECLFSRGSFEFWQMDALEHEIYNMQLEKKPEGEIKPKKDLLVERGKVMSAYQGLSIQNFKQYMAAYPMDKTPLDWIWKAYFQLGNFQAAVATLDELLDTDIIKDKARESYLEIRSEIKDYLVKVQLDATTPKPGSPERPVKMRVDAAGPG